MENMAAWPGAKGQPPQPQPRGVPAPLVAPEVGLQTSEGLLMWLAMEKVGLGRGEGLAWGTDTRFQGQGSGPDTRARLGHPTPIPRTVCLWQRAI